jgi:sporadic carbohydrate cluster protein (TIGR04323 family)
MQNELYTYSLPRPFSGLNIPIAIQSAYLRGYAHSNKYIFVLPKVEWFIPNSYIELYKLLHDSSVNNLAMSSIRMLPTDHHLIKSILPLREIALHFVLENKVILSSNLLYYLSEHKKICALASDSHYAIS